MDVEALDERVARQLETLRREFADEVPGEQVTEIGTARYESLRASARIPETRGRGLLDAFDDVQGLNADSAGR
jgi:hypothetical protein